MDKKVCNIYFRLSGVMPNEFDMNEPHFRHFEIINHNK